MIYTALRSEGNKKPTVEFKTITGFSKAEKKTSDFSKQQPQ